MDKPEKVIAYKDDGTSIELNLTENDAVSLLIAMREVFGWSGTEFTRKDIEHTLDRPLTDEEWEKARNSREWSRTLPEQACEAGFWGVDLVISEVLDG